MNYAITERKIRSKQPTSLNFLIGFSYYYNGQMELMLSKEFSVSNITRLYEISFMNESTLIIPPEDFVNLSILISKKSTNNDNINYPNFYNRFGVQPISVIQPLMQRALFSMKFKSCYKNNECEVLIPSEESKTFISSSAEYKRIFETYPRNIVNREMFLGAQCVGNDKLKLDYTGNSHYISEIDLDNIFKLPDSIQKIVDKYKNANDPQMEFDFGE